MLTGNSEKFIVTLHFNHMIMFNRDTNLRKISYLGVSLCCSEFHMSKIL